MNRSIILAALVLATPISWMPTSSPSASDRSLPMHFELRMQGPPSACGSNCLKLIGASGAITADSPRQFVAFAKKNDLTGATVVLDSDGGSVHGAIALGREFRKLNLATTVGSLIDLPADAHSEPRAMLSPRADCESMCAFLLLGGIQRSVPSESRVMVHQIWLGDRREDPTAASYSAEDLVLVQRDIGRLAQYTAEMGASIDLLDVALRIPPWEPMHALTREELRRTRLVTDDIDIPTPATVARSVPKSSPQPEARVTDGAQMATISQQRWTLVNESGVGSLARHHPLTFEGEEIGSFDLVVACGSNADSYDVTYIERRYSGEEMQLPVALQTVSLRVGKHAAALKVVSSERRNADEHLVTHAVGRVPAALIRAFAAMGSHSMLVKTESSNLATAIRIGNTGASQNLPRLAAACGKAPGERADLSKAKTGLAAVK
ncbi:MAG TPA: hypothetical protein VFP60_15950 [Pseudolabrys sp.]|nr:hypothetical protein [Pseudolabrys sp.]